MPRVIAGTLGGRRFAAPPGERTRPTSERVREALASALAARLPGAVVLDLFAGSGAYAIEARSRGAARTVSVDVARQATRVLADNIAALGLTDAEVITADARTFCADPRGGPFDLVLADPPYAYPAGALAACLAALARADALTPGALVVLERDRRDLDALERVRPAGFAALRERRYGDTVLVWWRYDGAEDVPDADPP